MIATGAPAPLTWGSALSAWEFSAPVTTGLITVAVVYLVATVRVSTRHRSRRWPMPRTAAFLLALAVITYATQGCVAAYDDVLFSMHMAQHLMLIMIAPPLLVVGRPITLLMHAFGNPWHTWIKRLVRSRVATIATWPPVATAGYVAVVVGTHLTGFMNLVLRNPAVHDGEHVLYLVAGYLFFLPLIGSEPIRHKMSLGAKFALLVLTMPVDTFVGVVLMMEPREPFPAYATTGRLWGQSPVGDLHTGGAVMWIGGDAAMAVLILLVTIGFIRSGDRKTLGPWIEQARAATIQQHFQQGRVTAPAHVRPGATIDDEQHLAAYNAYLSAIHRSDVDPPHDDT